MKRPFVFSLDKQAVPRAGYPRPDALVKSVTCSSTPARLGRLGPQVGDRPAHNTWASPSVARPAPGAPGVEVSPGTLGVQYGALSLQTTALAKKPASGQGPRLPPNPLLTPHLPAGRTMQVAPQAGWAGPSGLRPPTVPPAAPQAEAPVQRGPHPSPHPAAPAACAQRAFVAGCRPPPLTTHSRKDTLETWARPLLRPSGAGQGRAPFIRFRRRKTFSARRPRAPAPRRWPAGRR